MPVFKPDMETPSLKSLLLCLALASWFFQPKLWAICATLIKGPLSIDVQQCKAVQPEQAFPRSDSKYNFIQDLPPANRAAFLDTYRGLLIRGTVARSGAVRSGLTNEKGALNGESILAYIEPQGIAAQLSCQAIQNRRIQATVDEVCCEGGGEAPCLLGSSYLLKQTQVSSEAASKNGPGGRARGPTQEALALMAKRDFRGSAALLEKARSQKKIDVQGLYLLGLSYRELDQCPKALPLLEVLYTRLESNAAAAEEEEFLRNGTLLYARCLSMLNQAGEAVLALQAFLIEPKKFKKEIQQSLQHQDFGWIRTDKQYIRYQESAKRALANKNIP